MRKSVKKRLANEWRRSKYSNHYTFSQLTSWRPAAPWVFCWKLPTSCCVDVSGGTRKTIIASVNFFEAIFWSIMPAGNQIGFLIFLGGRYIKRKKFHNAFTFSPISSMIFRGKKVWTFSVECSLRNTFESYIFFRWSCSS